MNYPSIAVADLVETETVTRTVTSVAQGNRRTTFTVDVDAPPGFDVSVSPERITLRPGQSATYEVTITDDGSAAINEWAFGSLTWMSDRGHNPAYEVRSPLAVKVQPFVLEETWASTYSGPAHINLGSAMAVDPDGSGTFVTGYTRVADNALDWDYATVAYDAGGNEVWAARYDGPAGGGFDAPTAIGVSPDGERVFVTGYSVGVDTGNDYATVAYDAATGQQLWVARYTGPAAGAQDRPWALGVSPDGSRVFVTGHSIGADTERDFATVAYDASNGSEVWAMRYDGPVSGDDSARALAVSPDGSHVLITGYSTTAEHDGQRVYFDYTTMALAAADGERLWIRHYEGRGGETDVAFALALSPDGSVAYVTGYSDGDARFEGGRPNEDYATVAYDVTDGTRLWVARYEGPDQYRASGPFNDRATAVAVSPDGSRVFVTGTSPIDGTNNDYVTVAYSADDGSELWRARYNGPGNTYDNARDVGVSPDGTTVFVTGDSIGLGTKIDYATVAYDAATGQHLGIARYNGSANQADLATASGVSPDGSQLFVFGRGSPGPGKTALITLGYDLDVLHRRSDPPPG